MLIFVKKYQLAVEFCSFINLATDYKNCSLLIDQTFFTLEGSGAPHIQTISYTMYQKLWQYFTFCIDGVMKHNISTINHRGTPIQNFWVGQIWGPQSTLYKRSMKSQTINSYD